MSVEDEDGNPAENTWKTVWPSSWPAKKWTGTTASGGPTVLQHVLFESFDTADEPTWYISDPADPEKPDAGRRYPRALTRNAGLYLTVITLAFDEKRPVRRHHRQRRCELGSRGVRVCGRRELASRANDPLVLVQNRRQTRDQGA